MSIGRTRDGLVEAYLGDPGRDLPSEERHHWLSFDTLPPAAATRCASATTSSASGWALPPGW
ncbi:hypothetical protein ABZT51_44125 [Streptomyces sp. NPDC005373]|uniref:hypothetical protein n=1 Tax=Streptomyces sp. NPDC005373 TaxID=3156879 RepID=UPI0033B4F5BE